MNAATEAEVVNALPHEGFLLNYCAWARPQTDAPLAYHLATGLALLAASAPADLCVTYAGPPTHANLFTLVVGRSGEDRKSSATGIGYGLLKDVAPSLVADEPGSWEGFVDSLQTQPAKLIYYSEFGSFLQSSQNNGGYFGTLKTKYNEAYDARPMTRVLANGKVSRTDNPRVTLLGACATPYLEAHATPLDWTAGFMGRWLLMYAHRERTYPRGQPAPAHVETWLRADLLSRTYTPSAGPWVGFSGRTEQRWTEWFHDVNNRPLPEHVIGIRSRVPTIAMKCALLLAWDYNPDVRRGIPWAFDEGTLEPAIRIAELHFQSVVALFEVLAESKDMRDRRRVLDVLYGGPLPFGAIVKASKLLKRRCQELIESLITEGTVIPLTRDGDVLYLRLGHVQTNA